nr:MAG TPA: KilAC domain protein [Caudoviricetes sp.]
MNELITTQHDETINSQTLLKMVNEARRLCGEKPVRNNDFIAKVKDELDGEAYEIFVTPMDKTKGGADQVTIVMSYKQAMRVAARESKAVRRSLIDQLETMRQSAAKSTFPVPQTMGEALRLAADLWEEKERLKLILQQTVRYYDVLRVVKANPDFGLDAKNLWRPLKSWCVEANVEVKRVFCPRYGSVNAYPYEAWRAVYPALELPREAATLLENMERKDE